MYASIVVIAAGLAGLVTAQSPTPTVSDQPLPYTVDPNSIPLPTRESWCQAQYNSCLQLCDNRYLHNLCDPNLLTYDCVCSDGTTPNSTQYMSTLSFFECQAYVAQCVESTTDPETQHKCHAIDCGSKSPLSALSSASLAAKSTMMSSMMTSSMMSSTSHKAASATSSMSMSTSSGAAMPVYAQNTNSLGSSAFAAGLLALFGLVL